MNDNDIDEVARAMSDDKRNDYLLAHGWWSTGAGWIPPDGTEEHVPSGGVIRTMTSGLYSRSTAIREALAREENPDAVPNELGRYYRGAEPEDTIGKRW